MVIIVEVGSPAQSKSEATPSRQAGGLRGVVPLMVIMVEVGSNETP
jgi:hypothetical protein